MEETTGDAGKTKGDAMTFTDKKPTVPGAYACRTGSTVSLVFVYKSGDRLVSGGFPVEDLDRLWSSRLVPSDESEAYQEGYQHAFDEIVHSRALRVVERKETP